jgi:hypothetical protein
MPEGRGGDVQTVPIDSTQSQRTLAELGFQYPPVSSAWLGKFLQHAIEVGFVEAPRFWNLGGVVGRLI